MLGSPVHRYTWTTDGIFDWLDINLEKELMSIIMRGHVESGKSTTTGCIFFELDGILERELDKLEQDEECFEKSSLLYIFFMARQKEEWKRGVNTTCNANDLFTDKKHYTIIDTLGCRHFSKNTVKGSSQAEATLILVPADRKFIVTMDRQFLSAGKSKDRHGSIRDRAIFLG